mgnify:CR=1 FL=1
MAVTLNGERYLSDSFTVDYTAAVTTYTVSFDANGGTGASITVSADTKLYAIWETIPVIEYTITFNGNGGTPSVGTMTTIDSKLTSLPTATHSGRYNFAGWYTEASGGTQI